MKHSIGPTAMLILLAFSSAADAQERVLFAFDQPQAAQQWQSVNDGVMGGRSDGRFQITPQNTLRFFGTLSLENNGGFASVRTVPSTLNLSPNQTIVLRVRGDGREYSLNLYVPARRMAFSYRASFQTVRDQWTEVQLSLDRFVATSFGNPMPNLALDPKQVNGLGILLGDKKSGPFELEVDWIKLSSGESAELPLSLECEGVYPHHLQGICTDGNSIYWSFTTQLVKTDRQGKRQQQIAVANHHGDLCLHDGKLYVAVNLGKFNDSAGNADSWVYVYDAKTLNETARHPVPQVFHGAGGIGYRQGHFFVVGGLPDGIQENYVYEYDEQFQFIKRHVIQSGHTLMGIQTATFAHDRWWFGCYGDPKILLVTDTNFQMLGRHEFDCSLGVEGLPDGRLLAASGRCDSQQGCNGTARIVIPDPQTGLKPWQPTEDILNGE